MAVWSTGTVTWLCKKSLADTACTPAPPQTLSGTLGQSFHVTVNFMCQGARATGHPDLSPGTIPGASVRVFGDETHISVR